MRSSLRLRVFQEVNSFHQLIAKLSTLKAAGSRLPKRNETIDQGNRYCNSIKTRVSVECFIK